MPKTTPRSQRNRIRESSDPAARARASRQERPSDRRRHPAPPPAARTIASAGRRKRPALRLLPRSRRTRGIRHLGRATLTRRRGTRPRPRLTARLLASAVPAALHPPRRTGTDAPRQRDRAHRDAHPQHKPRTPLRQPSPHTAKTDPSRTPDSTSSTSSKATSSSASTTPTTRWPPASASSGPRRTNTRSATTPTSPHARSDSSPRPCTR